MKYTLDISCLQAAIFDMDGTMVDNMSFHKKAWYSFSKKYGFPLTEAIFKKKFSGRKNNQILPVIFGRNLSVDEIQTYAEEKEALYRTLYKNHVIPMKKLIEFIRLLKQHGLKVAIGTTANYGNRLFVLEELAITDLFDAIIGEEDFIHGKPDPDLFLTVARRLGISPDKCIVFEDAPLGIEAAKRAGMQSIGILTSHHHNEFKGALATIHDFTKITI